MILLNVENHTERGGKLMESNAHGWVIPRWLLVVVGAMARFVLGSFGIRKPHPWRAHICGYMWIVGLGGCTIGLPFVLLSYLLQGIWRGGGRGGGTLLKKSGIAQFVEDFVENHESLLKTIGIWLIGLVLGGCTLFAIGFMIWALIDWLGWFGALIFIFLIICASVTIVGVGVGAYQLSQYLANRHPAKNEKLTTKVNPVARFLKKSGTIAITPARGIWQIFAFLGYMIYTTIKDLCPIVEFP